MNFNPEFNRRGDPNPHTSRILKSEFQGMSPNAETLKANQLNLMVKLAQEFAKPNFTIKGFTQTEITDMKIDDRNAILNAYEAMKLDITHGARPGTKQTNAHHQAEKILNKVKDLQTGT